MCVIREYESYASPAPYLFLDKILFLSYKLRSTETNANLDLFFTFPKVADATGWLATITAKKPSGACHTLLD